MIFLVGPHGAGKTESAKMLVQMGFAAIDLGPTLRAVHEREARDIPMNEWIAQGERASGIHFTDALLATELENLRLAVERETSHADILVVGSRSYRGVRYLEQAIPCVNGHGNVVIFIDAPFETLRMRYNSREGQTNTSEEFQAVLDRDVALGLESLRIRADVTVWNDGTLRCLERTLREVLHGFGYHQVKQHG